MINLHSQSITFTLPAGGRTVTGNYWDNVDSSTFAARETDDSAEKGSYNEQEGCEALAGEKASHCWKLRGINY
jgi:hypothetical protein